MVIKNILATNFIAENIDCFRNKCDQFALNNILKRAAVVLWHRLQKKKVLLTMNLLGGVVVVYECNVRDTDAKNNKSVFVKFPFIPLKP